MAIPAGGGQYEGDDTHRELVRTLPEVPSKGTIDDWKDTAAEYVRSDLFDKKQFVLDCDLAWGRKIQKLVIINLHIEGETRARRFWDETGGKETVRNTFRRKRQSAQNAMKLAFRGKYTATDLHELKWFNNISCSNTNVYLRHVKNGLEKRRKVTCQIQLHQR